jgi:cation:H+ antiporter
MTTMAYLAGGLLLLFVGGEMMVRGAAALGMRLGLSPLATGLTIVAFGTSAPELVVNIDAASMGAGGLAVGNVIGSNIANIGLVFGLAVVIQPMQLDLKVVRNDIYIMLGATALATFFLLDGYLDRVEGLVLVTGIVGYVWYNLRAAARERAAVQDRAEAGLPGTKGPVWVDAAFLFGGLAGLLVGGHWFVHGAVDLATALGVPAAVIGLSVVAIGTSLPEIFTTVIAAWRGHSGIAIGNVVGSNIFNVMSVLGITSVMLPLDSGAVNRGDLLVFVLAGAVMLRLIQTDSRMDRWEGGVLLAGFILYLSWRVI